MNPVERSAKWLVPLILSILLVIAFYDIVFLDKTFKVSTANSQALPTGVYGQEFNRPSFIPVNGTDSPVLEEPLYQFIKNNLRKGIFPLWNPHQACGYSLVGMIETAIFYPLNIILYLLPSRYNWDILILTRLFLAGLLTFWFMRFMKFKTIPSLASAITFMLSGPMVLLQYWTANVDILLPLLCIAIENLFRRPGHKAMVALTCVIGLTILGGHPEHILLVNSFGILFFIYRACVLKAPREKTLSACGHLTKAYVLSAGLTAFLLFPFFRNLLMDSWHGHPFNAGTMMEEQADRAITLALPHFFQKEAITFQWVFAGWWGGYLGTLPIIVGLLSLLKNQKRGLNYFFAISAFLIISKEYSLPYINWIGYLPLFNLVRYAIHTPPMAAFCVAVLTGMGVRTLMSRKKTLPATILLSCVLLLTAAAHLWIYRTSEHFELSLRAALYCFFILSLLLILIIVHKYKNLNRSLFGGISAGLIFIELFSYLHREHPKKFDSFPPVPYIELLKTSPVPIRSYGNFWAFYPNTASGYGVDDLGYFLGMAPKRFVEFINNILVPGHFTKDFRSPALRAFPVQGQEDILDLLNVEYIILPSNEELVRPFQRFRSIEETAAEVYRKEVRVYKRPHVFDRAFIVHRAVFTRSAQETFSAVEQFKAQLRGIAILEGPNDPALISRLNKTPLVDRSYVEFVTHSPHEIVIKARLEHDGMLVISDAYHPEWKAFVDEKETLIYPAYHLIRAVFVPAGNHTVRFVFAPSSFFAGAWTSCLTAALLAALFFFKNTNKKGRA